MKERRTLVRDMSERREFVRVGIERPIEITVDGKWSLSAEGGNLSEKGVLCVSERAVEPHTSAKIRFVLPLRHEQYEVQCEGTILRSVEQIDAHSVAIQFHELADEDLVAIGAYSRLMAAEQEAAMISSLARKKPGDDPVSKEKS
jgi:c-di-GMP-binding flagellar brake protein YcgR